MSFPLSSNFDELSLPTRHSAPTVKITKFKKSSSPKNSNNFYHEKNDDPVFSATSTVTRLARLGNSKRELRYTGLPLSRFHDSVKEIFRSE